MIVSLFRLPKNGEAIKEMICKAWELRTYNLEDLLLSKYL